MPDGILMKSRSASFLFGGALVLLSALCYAWMPVLAKLAYGTGLEPHSVLILRYLFTAVILLVIIKYRGDRSFRLSLSLVAQGVFFAAGGLFFFYSLKSINAGLSIIIFFSHPVIISLIAVIFLREKPGWFHAAGLLFATAGIIIISLSGGEEIRVNSTGVVLSLASSLCYSFYSLLSERNTKNSGSASITAAMALIGLAIVMPLFYDRLDFFVSLSAQQIFIVIMMSLVSTMLAVIFFLEGVKRLGAARASIAGMAEPVFVALIAYLMLGEVLSYTEGAGSLMILAGVGISVSSRN
ncbi:MAG TPA: DMT family transporter [Spirochaetota bacterium]|nr:DMT family transporter [Spirochaetota bacterium]HPJ43964.1 DMT family transporter [Spirochaetota bacterium]HPR37234.1 DMT family transporter [Spirochaetota bacterium]HRX49236.1 DMT family transporter [Spirochaetota bacterium]